MIIYCIVKRRKLRLKNREQNIVIENGANTSQMKMSFLNGPSTLTLATDNSKGFVEKQQSVENIYSSIDHNQDNDTNHSDGDEYDKPSNTQSVIFKASNYNHLARLEKPNYSSVLEKHLDKRDTSIYSFAKRPKENECLTKLTTDQWVDQSIARLIDRYMCIDGSEPKSMR